MVAISSTESGLSKGSSLKKAMRHGRHEQLLTFSSACASPPSGFILVELKPDSLYIAVQSLHSESDHRGPKAVVIIPDFLADLKEPAAPVKPAAPAPTAGQPLRRFGFKKPAAPVVEMTVSEPVTFDEPPAPAPVKKGFKRRLV
jgi:hypothetical protein